MTTTAAAQHSSDPAADRPDTTARAAGPDPAGPQDRRAHRPGEAPAALAERLARLEAAFGPMEDTANPLGSRALLAADSRGEVLPEAEAVLDACGLNDEFVPAEHGGRLTRLDELGRVLRPVFRRDASTGFGYGLNCFFAAVPVWTAGSTDQQRQAAGLLLDGDRVAVARHEVAHGNDFVRDEFAAVRHGDGHLLSGSKAVIANADRAHGLVAFARTADAPGGRSHSVFLLDRREVPPGTLVSTGRRATTGMRSARFGGLRAADCPLPAGALIAGEGDGYQLSLRSSLVIRGLIPSIVLSGGDTALRTVLRFAVHRHHDGRRRLDVQHVRDVLTGAFLDLLLSDCLALVATRALHLLPRQMSAYAAAAAYVAPKLVAESMDELSAVLGQESLATEGTYGMFHKQLRDLPVTSLGHAGSAGRQVSILPQLPHFARHCWFRDDVPADSLFRLHEPLPPLDLAAPALLGDSDPLIAALTAAAEDEHPAVRAAAQPLVAELRHLREVFDAVEPGDRAALVSPHSFALADRYALLVAAAACLGVHTAQRTHRAGAAGQGRAEAFLADPAWAVAALGRLGRRLGLPLPGRPAAAAERRVLDEALDRLETRRGLDLYATPLA